LRRRGSRFLFAAAVVAAMAVLTAIMQWLFRSLPASLLAFSVILCTGFLGFGAGLFTAALAGLAFDLFFTPPILRLNLDDLTLQATLLFAVLAIGTHLAERRISARIRKQVKPPLGVHGRLDGLVDGELYGWVFDADHPSKPVVVTVLLNRKPVATLAAVYYRPDVAEAMQCSGRHGFYIDLAEQFVSPSVATLDVQLPNRTSIPNAPLQLSIPAVTPRKPRPTILFMHIAKTAGTAFREAIAANFLQSEIAYLYPTPPGFLIDDLLVLPIEQRKALRIVIGHFQFGLHETLPQSSEYITVVREPVARVLSQYAYVRQMQPELLRRSDGGLLTLPELFDKRLTVNFDNVLVRCFGGVNERKFPAGHLTSELFERAVHHLRTSFAFVGHQETSSEAFSWLRQHYGWQATMDLPRVNLGTEQSRKPVNPDLEAAIRHYNRWDLLLYQEILRLFPLRSATAPEATS
jgi:Domain of unknown function (DUF4118)/Galactose-3-O-sulfotransferase